MTKEELAALINGSQYPFSLSDELLAAAKQAGLVVVFGASDDLMEFEGAINDEVGCCNGGSAFIDGDKLFDENGCDGSKCKYFEAAKAALKDTEIKAIWDQDGYSWIYETQIPHATFEIIEDGEKYCRGIVFDLKDVPAPTGGDHA